MHISRQFGLFLILAFGLLNTASGADVIGPSPLFLTSRVEPNVMFTLDDSGSMQFEIMPDDYIFWGVRNGSVSFVFPRADNVYGGSDYPNRVATVDSGDAYTALTRSPQLNTIYYNPSITYTPWVKADGTLYPPAVRSCALHNPERPGSGAAYCRDLTTTNTSDNSNSWRTCTSTGSCSSSATKKSFWPATYYWHTGGSIWNWSNFQKVEIKPSTTAYSGHGRESRTDCTGGVCTYDQEIQNFANWYTYYRSRILTARAGVGRAFSQQGSSMRVGFGAINKGSTTVDGVLTQTVISGVRKFEGTVRSNFFSTLYGHAIPAAGTPLRKALDDVGQYFKRTDDKGPWGETPGSTGGTQFECRQNYHILMTDGYWSGGSTYQAGTPAARNNNDGIEGPTITGPGGLSFTYEAISPFADSYSNTLADVAMYYWKNDLRTDLPNKVPTTATDPAFWQHVVTFGIGLGVTGSVDPETAWNAITDGTSISWPNTNPDVTNCSGATCPARLDDLLHATINSRGGFFSASDPEGFANALSDTLASINLRTTSSAAAVASNSTRLNTATMVYQARFNSREWNGQILAFKLNMDGSLGTVQWDTDTTLASVDPATRKVWTRNGTSGVDFAWANLSSTQQNALNKNGSGTADGKGEDRVDWLRGATVDGFRVRSKILGDIVNSDPAFVAAENYGYVKHPELNGGGEVYLEFLAGKQSRKQMLYVGANDGMLHAFDADTGKEQFAYVPAGVYENLNKLTDPAYSHRYFVDGSPLAWDACIGPRRSFTKSDGTTVTTSCTWRTVLVGSLGAGGKTIYALDITDPTSADFGKPLWEFSHDDLGYLAGPPQVVKLATGQWAAIFGNGYRSKNCEDLLNNVTTNPKRNCSARLFAVNLTNGELISGFPVDTKAGDNAASGDTGKTNGILSPPAIYDVSTRILGDERDSGTTLGDGIYAGDLQGNLWRFIYKLPGGWQVAYKTGSTPAPLFIAKDGLGNRQPITAPLEIGESPVSGQGVMVFFGTGRYFATTDTTNTSRQTFYGIWDDGTKINTYTSRDEVLQAQTIILESTAFGREIRVVSNNPVTWSGGGAKRGWYLDLVSPVFGAQGERVVSAPLLRFGRVIFNTLIPSTDPCSAGGTSWLMELDAHTGARLGYSVFDLNKDGFFNADDYGSAGDAAAPVSGLKSTVGISKTPAVISAGEKEYKVQSGTDLGGLTQGLLVTTEKGGIGKPRGAWRQLFQE